MDNPETRPGTGMTRLVHRFMSWSALRNLATCPDQRAKKSDSELDALMVSMSWRPPMAVPESLPFS